MQENIDWIDLPEVLERRFKPDAERSDRLRTGFSSLDQILGGGLSPGLIILGGTPGVGKSTLALQIAAHVAESGHPVLYFSLEMPASRILAKAISRKIYENALPNDKPSCVTADKLLDGTLEEAQWGEIEAVKQTLPLKNLHVCTKSLSASGILEWVKSFSGNGKKPLVIIDYLQILRPEKGAQSDKQIVDSSLRCLMQLALGLSGSSSSQQDIDTGNGLPVILISSLNRSSYKGAIKISSFKETGDIEYSADLLLGLQFQNHDSDPNAEMVKSIREVELTVLKNRYGSCGGTIPLLYDPAHDCFFPPPNESAGEAPGLGPEKQNSERTAKKRPVSDLKAPTGDFSAASVSKHRKNGTAVKTRSEPLSCVINNTMVANELHEGVSGERSCKLFTDKKSKEDIYTSYAVSEPLSSLDCCVADAIFTLVQQQKKEKFPLQSILQILHGCHRAALTKQKREMLEHSIQHMQKVQFHLDCSQHLQTDWVYDGPFLAIEGPDKNGVYRLVQGKDILPLHSYGAKAKQMITVPPVLLDVAKKDGTHLRHLNNTPDNICLKQFLARRMEIIRYKDSETREYLRTISFGSDSNLWQEFRLTEPLDSAGEQRLKRLHKSMKAILDYYQRIGYIEKFEERDNDRSRKSKDQKDKRYPHSFEIIGTINDPKKL